MRFNKQPCQSQRHAGAGQLRRLGPGHGTWHFDRLLAAHKPGGTVGALLSIEGLQNLEGKLENLDKLRKLGYTEVYPLRGGLNAWLGASLPVTTK